MKLRIAGLCLVAMFAMGMTMAATASAAPVWEQCAEGGSTTKYSEHQCVKAESTGKWSWQEVKATEKVVSHLSLTLADIKIPIVGRVAVTCSARDEGSVGPGKLDRIEKITEIKCSTGEHCEEVSEVEALNLPWQTEIFEIEKTTRDRITNGKTKTEAPGWKIKCKVLGFKEEDRCTNNEETTLLSNALEGGVLSVLASFEGGSGKGECKVGGAGAGEIAGVDSNSKENGSGLRVAGAGPPPPPPPTPPSIEQVNFLNNIAVSIDHRENQVTEKAISIGEYGTTEKEVEWLAGTNKKNWPVVYPQKTVVKLKAQFSLEPSTRIFLKEKLEAESKVVLVGELVLKTTTLTFKKELTVAAVKKQLEEHEAYLATEEVESNKALPEEVRLYEKGSTNTANIIWKWTVKSNGATYKQGMGTSEHNLYLTLASPVKRAGANIVVYLTLLDLGTQGIEKAGTAQPPVEAEAIKAIWKEFESRSIGFRWYEVPTGTLHRGGKALAYYEEIAPGKTLKEVAALGAGACNIFAVAALLENGKGQCGAWAESFSYSLASEGIPSGVLEVAAKFVEPTEGCEVVKTCNFLVKNWEFNTEKTVPTLPYKATDLKDLEGVEGQGGIKNPQSAFGNHYIVEPKITEKNLYDPSYGTAPFIGAEPGRLKEYQEKSIAGFCGRFEALTFEAKCQKAPTALQLVTSLVLKFE